MTSTNGKDVLFVGAASGSNRAVNATHQFGVIILGLEASLIADLVSVVKSVSCFTSTDGIDIIGMSAASYIRRTGHARQEIDIPIVEGRAAVAEVVLNVLLVT